MRSSSSSGCCSRSRTPTTRSSTSTQSSRILETTRRPGDGRPAGTHTSAWEDLSSTEPQRQLRRERPDHCGARARPHGKFPDGRLRHLSGQVLADDLAHICGLGTGQAALRGSRTATARASQTVSSRSSAPTRSTASRCSTFGGTRRCRSAAGRIPDTDAVHDRHVGRRLDLPALREEMHQGSTLTVRHHLQVAAADGRQPREPRSRRPAGLQAHHRKRQRRRQLLAGSGEHHRHRRQHVAGRHLVGQLLVGASGRARGPAGRAVLGQRVRPSGRPSLHRAGRTPGPISRQAASSRPTPTRTGTSPRRPPRSVSGRTIRFDTVDFASRTWTTDYRAYTVTSFMPTGTAPVPMRSVAGLQTGVASRRLQISQGTYTLGRQGDDRRLPALHYRQQLPSGSGPSPSTIVVRRLDLPAAAGGHDRRRLDADRDVGLERAGVDRLTEGRLRRAAGIHAHRHAHGALAACTVNGGRRGRAARPRSRA